MLERGIKQLLEEQRQLFSYLYHIFQSEQRNQLLKILTEIQKREKAQKLSATRIKAQRAAAEKNYDLAISIWNECRQYTSNTAEQKEINDNIKLIEETRPFTFIVRAIRIYCENIDDGIEGRSITDPGGHTDRDAEIYGQVSMRVEGTNFNNNSSDIVPFWRILKENKQPMSQGKTYQLNQQLNRTVTIKGVSALKAARFILIGNGTNNELRNGIIDDDGSNDDPERMEASPFTLKEKFIDIKAKGKMRFNHKFTTGTGKNEVIFTYEIEYWK